MIVASYKKFLKVKTIFSFIESGKFYTGICRKRLTLPPLVVWNITYLCYSRCATCYRWKRYNPKLELSTEEKRDLIKQMGRLGLPILSISGGEPLVMEDIFEIVKEAKNQNIILNINTNGRHIKNHLGAVLMSDTVSISIDSVKEANFKRIRGYSLKEVENNLLLLTETKKAVKSKTQINLRMAVNSMNYREIVPLYRKWNNFVDSIQYQPAHDDELVYFKNNGPVDANFVRMQFQELARWDRRYNNRYYRNFHLFFNAKSKLKKKFLRCYSFYFFLAIDPYGNLYNCGAYRKRIGNVKDEGIISLINKREEIKNDSKTIDNCFCYYHCSILNIALQGLPRFWLMR